MVFFPNVDDHTAVTLNFFNTTIDLDAIDWAWLAADDSTKAADQAADTDPSSTVWIVVLCVIAAGTSLVTMGGNLIVILSFALERSIRQPSNYFIASLAVSDFLIGAVSMPFKACSHLCNWV